MDTPRTRAEFERNFYLLHQLLKEGKLKLSKSVSLTIDGLLRVRYLPNRRIDFLSVDEMARLQANMTAQFDEELREEMLKKTEATKQEPDAADGGEPKC